MTARTATVSFRAMLVATTLAFGGFAVLLTAVPLWTAGAGELAAGSTTGVLMLTTIGTQTLVPRLAARFGHRAVLGAGLVLLGAPTPLLALSSDLVPVLAVTAARGVGFGLLTVTGSVLVAELSPPETQGRAAARYGLSVGLPQIVLVPAGAVLVDTIGFTAVFVGAGVLPLLGLAALPALRVARPAGADPDAEDAPPAPGPLRRRMAGPVVAMLLCSVVQGGLLTFLPLAVPDDRLLVAVALFAVSSGTLVGRLAAGRWVDRHAMGGRLLRPGVALAALGMAGEVLAVGIGGGPLVPIAAAAVGIGFGLVQNDSLTTLFAIAGPQRYGSASAAWNIAYDAGTGLGAVGIGAVAQPFGFGAAFGVSAALLVAVLPVVRGVRPGRGPADRARGPRRPAGRRR